MFGWLRKSSKEQSHSKKSNANKVAPPTYVHVDARVSVKPLDAIEDEEITGRDRPHSVTAARPYFQAKQHLDQQEQKETDGHTAQSFTDDEDNYNEDDHQIHADNNDNDSDSGSDSSSSSSSHNKHIATVPAPQPKSPAKAKKTKLRSFKQKEVQHTSADVAKDAPTQPSFTPPKNETTEYKKDSDVSDTTIIQSTNHTQEPVIQPTPWEQEDDDDDPPAPPVQTESKSNTLDHPGLKSVNSKTRRGFSKRKSKSKQLGSNQKLQRRRSSGRKTRSFTVNAIPNMKPSTASNVQVAITIQEDQETEQERKRKTPKVQGKQSPRKTPKTPKTPSESSMHGVLVVRVEQWLKRNNLWFEADKGEKLLNVLLESGIEDPTNDLALLSVHPDLTEIAQSATLNILERRKFINAAHAKIDEYRDGDEGRKDKQMQQQKVHIVMSTEEQEALAKMDSIIEQLKHTRKLIRGRISAISDGGVECEAAIRNEFCELRTLLSAREEELVSVMREKVHAKIDSLTVLDEDLRLSLEGCQNGKLSAQKLMKTNKQPRVSRSKWRVLQGRKKAVMDLIEKCIASQIVDHSNARVNELIISRMSMRDMQPSLPKPLIAQYGASGRHQRHYDSLNPYLLNIFTKNMRQIHLELSVAGFAFNYTERGKMHHELREYGVICDVEESVRKELSVKLKYKEECVAAAYDVASSKMILINPEDYEKKRKKKNAYATLQIQVRMSEAQANEWRMIMDGSDIDCCSVLNAQRIKEIETQIGMKRRSNYYDDEEEECQAFDEEEFGWVSLGWCDAEEIFIETEESAQFAYEFVLKKEFQEVMTQTFLASLELEVIANEYDATIDREELEQMVIAQLANDELFEFCSQNVDEFERKFMICCRMRCRDRINVTMTGAAKAKKSSQIVSQSHFSRLSVIHFGLLRPMVSVLAEAAKHRDSPYLNGFISIVGNESLQFIDPIRSDRSCVLSAQLPCDVDSCGLIIDFIRFKHPTLDSEMQSMTPSTDNCTATDVCSLLRTINNKKLSILRIGGAMRNEESGRRMTGRLDIFNIYCASWIQIGELEPFRENMACTMFYGRVCVTGGAVCEIATDIVQEFSFSERKFKPLQHLNIARFGHCMCAFSNKPSKLFVYGGETHAGEWTNTIEIYDPPKRSWAITIASQYKRYGSSCCVWNDAIIIVGGQSEEDESSKHCELFCFSNKTYQMKQIHDLNLEHGIFPAVWCDADDNSIYVSSQYVLVDNKNKQKSIIKYRVERLDQPNSKWRVIKSNRHRFITQNSFQIIKNSNAWNANAIRKSCGVSLKIM